MTRRVVVRCDASAEIGSGHVMRCLTLANTLRENGTEVSFVCRDHPGHLFTLIESLDYRLFRLPSAASASSGRLPHAHWLGVTQEEDARQTVEAIAAIGEIAWLIIDHYALDAEWERILHPYAERIMVIDDLADREHDCDMLLDQNYYSEMNSRYERLVSKRCVTLLGPKYALLRSEFRDARERLRIRDGKVKRIFVFFGGSDLTNETGKALRAMELLGRHDIAVDIVLGPMNQNRSELARICAGFPSVTLHRSVGNIAELMANADLAVGAAGSTTWERCALALPGVVVSVADNQIAIAEGVGKTGAQLYLGAASELTPAAVAEAIRSLLDDPEKLVSMSAASYQLVDILGSRRVVEAMGIVL